jgi:hypothetical protein
MSTTHDDATSWRDLADQLTPEQIARMEDLERIYRAPQPRYSTVPTSDHEIAALLLHLARRHAIDNVTGALYADLPSPPGAVDVGDWISPSDDDDDPRPVRYFTGNQWATEPDDGQTITVKVSGAQYGDGSMQRQVCIESIADPVFLTAEQAHRAAAALVDAADEVDQNSDDRTDLARCDNCGRYGWHTTDRCLEPPTSTEGGAKR